MVERQDRAGVYGRQSRGKQKSIDEQIRLCTADALDQQWTVVETYRDRTSASRYRRKEREEWARVVQAVQDRAFDILVLWSSSRGDRDLTSWSGLLDACRRQGILIRITDDDRTYDVRRSGDWQALAQQGIGNAVDSDKISTSVRRGQAASAKTGRPSHGRTPYGYRRLYDPSTGNLVGQEPDPDTAPVVREIFERVKAGTAVSVITNDLNRRGVPTIGGAATWYRQRVRDLVNNCSYAGKRLYNGNEYDAEWEPLVAASVYYAARRVLADPKRVTTRPGATRHLLSYLGVCDPCGGPLEAVRGRYRCSAKGCVTIVQEHADRVVTGMLFARLAQPDLYDRMRQAGDDADRIVVTADTEAAQLREQLDGWRLSAAQGKTSPESLAVIEADLTRRIRDLEARAERATIDPSVRMLLEPGEDVELRWASMPLPAQRNVIRTFAEVRVDVAAVPGSRTFERARLGPSRWHGDDRTWADVWALVG